MATKFEQRLEGLKRKYGGGTPDKVPAPSTSSTPAPSQGGVGDIQAKMLKRLGIAAPAAPAQTPVPVVPVPASLMPKPPKTVEPPKAKSSPFAINPFGGMIPGGGVPQTKATQVAADTPEQTAATAAKKQQQVAQGYEARRQKYLTTPLGLLGGITNGEILPDDVAFLKPDDATLKTVFEIMAGKKAVPPASNFNHKEWAEIGKAGVQDQAKGLEMLIAKMQEREGSDAFRKTRVARQNLAESLTLGITQPTVATQDKGEEWLALGSQVVGALPSVLAAGGQTARLVPAALRGTAAGAIIQGGLTGATLQTAREGLGAVYRPEEFDAKEAAKNIVGNAAQYAAYMGIYSKLNPVVDKIVGAGAQQLGPVAIKVAESLAGEVVKGTATGAAAGLTVGTGTALIDALTEEGLDVRAVVRKALTEAGQEAKEELVEAVALGIASRFMGMMPQVNVEASAPTNQQTTPPQEQSNLERGLALANELVPPQTMPTASSAPAQQEQVPTPTPAVQTPPVASQTQATAPKPQGVSKTQRRSQMIRDANPGMDEKAILRLIKDTSNLSDTDFAAFAQRVGKPEPVSTATPEEATYKDGDRIQWRSFGNEWTGTVKRASGEALTVAPDDMTAWDDDVQINVTTNRVGRLEPASSNTNSINEMEALAEQGTPVLSSQVKKPVEKPKSYGETVKAGDKVVVEGRKGVFEVVDTKDPSLLRVRTASGAELPVGRATVKPVEQETPREVTATPRRQETPSALPPLTDNYRKPLSTYTRTLYREASILDALPYIPGSNTTDSAVSGEVFFANTPDLALGQGGNTGVMLEFDSANVQGSVNTRKPGWEIAYGTGQAEFVGSDNNAATMQSALRAVTVKPDAQSNPGHKRRLSTVLSALEKQGWVKTTNLDKSVTYRRPEQTSTVKDRLGSTVDGNTQGFAGVRPTAPTTQPKPLPPVKRKQIVDFLNEKFAPIKTGGVRGWFLGTFNKVTGVIRTKTAEDFPVQMHEVGHRLDQQLGLSANRSFDTELMPMGDPTTPPSKMKDHDYRRAEGVAEFLRLYMMEPVEVQKQAPTYYTAFEGIMQANPDVHLNLLEARQMVQRWFSQDPKDKVLGAISVGEGERSAPFSKDRLYQQAIDEFNPLQVIERKVTGGQELSVEESPYKLANLTRGWTGLAETFINHGVVDRDFNKVGEPLSQIMDEVESEDDFRAYIVAKRAQEKIGQGFTPEQLLGIGITEQEIEQVVADLEPKYGKLQQRLVKFQDAVLRQLVDAEVLSQEAANQIRLMNQEYVPFYRLMDPNLGTMSFASTTKFGNLPQPVKRLKGSGRTIVDPLESVIKNTYSILNVAARNRVAVAMDKLAEVTENKGEWWTEVSAPVRPVDFNLETVKRALENQGVDTDSLDLDKVVTIFAPLGKPRAAQNELTFFRNGQRKYVQVNEEVYKAMLGMETDAANTLVKLLSYPASMLRAGAVLDPGFAATNPMRDQLNAYVQSKYGYRPYFDMARGMFNVLGKTELYWKWVAAGGDQAAMVSMDRDSLQKQLDEHLKKGSIGRVIRRGNPVEFLRAVSAVMENSTRMGEFLRAVESQVQEQGNTPQNRTLSDRFTGRDLAKIADRGTLREAALAARDVTTDFSRKGSSVHSLNRVRAFFGATVQGLDKTYRTFRDNPVRTSIRAGITFTLPTILLYLLNRENPWYEEKPEWQKDAFWMVPTDWTNPTQSQHFLYLPKSHLYGQIFGAIPERILRWLDKNDKQAFDKEFAKRTLDQLLPTSANEGFIPIPTAMVPLLEVMTNHDFYTDLPVVPQREQRLEPKDRYSPYTSETAKGVASLIRPVLDTSPRNIDQLISGYGGGLTTTGIEVTESLLAKVGALDRVPKTDRGVAGYPVLKRFLRDAGGPGQGSSVEVYMNAMTKMEQRYASMSPGPEKERMLSAIRPYRKIDDTMADLRALKRDVLASEKLTPQQKREYVDRVDMAITNMARQALGKEPINN